MIRTCNLIVNLELSNYPKTYFDRLMKFSHLGDAKSARNSRPTFAIKGTYYLLTQTRIHRTSL